MAELKDIKTNVKIGSPDRVSVSLAFVRNLGDYQTARVELGVERDVPEGMNWEDGLRSLREKLDALVSEAVEEIDREAGKVNVTRRG